MSMGIMKKEKLLNDKLFVKNEMAQCSKLNRTCFFFADVKSVVAIQCSYKI